MPTYKEALKKLKGKSKKTRPKRKALRRARKPVKRKTVKKARPKKKEIAKKRKVIKRAKSRKRATKRKAKKKVVKKAKPRKKIKPKKKRKVIKKKRPLKKRKFVKRKKPVKKRVVKKRRIVKRRIVKKRKPRKKKVIKPRVYVGKGTLDQLFESQAKVKLLKFFFRNSTNIFQPKEIFKRLRSNVALLRQEMKKLEKLGLIKQKRVWLTFEKKRGGVRKERKIVFYLNPSFDFLNELRDLVLKSALTSKDELVEKARKIGNIKLLVLTGVFTGDETARADLLIVGDKINHRKLNNFIKDLESEVGKEINCAVMTSKEFDYRYDMYDRFVRDLLEGNCEILVKKLELW